MYDEEQIAYEFYDDWLNSGGKELKLGANRLTDRQMFWVAVARVSYVKYQLDDEVASRHFTDFSKKKGFVEAFKCTD